jgi:acyl-CoA dehydrogenase
MIAEAWMEIQQFRLFVLQTAWKIDRYNDYKKVRKDIAAAKVIASRVLVDVATKALQIHGSLGISDEMPFVSMIVNGLHVGIADGPSEIHKVTLAREILKNYQRHDGLFPSGHIPALVEAARQTYSETLARHGR